MTMRPAVHPLGSPYGREAAARLTVPIAVGTGWQTRHRALQKTARPDMRDLRRSAAPFRKTLPASCLLQRTVGAARSQMSLVNHHISHDIGIHDRDPQPSPGSQFMLAPGVCGAKNKSDP